MSDGFLSADCVFNFMSESGFIHHKEWKHETRELYYTASFFLNKQRISTVSFEVTVSNGCHKITASSIRLLEKRFSMNFAKIFLDCAI